MGIHLQEENRHLAGKIFKEIIETWYISCQNNTWGGDSFHQYLLNAMQLEMLYKFTGVQLWHTGISIFITELFQRSYAPKQVKTSMYLAYEQHYCSMALSFTSSSSVLATAVAIDIIQSGAVLSLRLFPVETWESVWSWHEAQHKDLSQNFPNSLKLFQFSNVCN